MVIPALAKLRPDVSEVNYTILFEHWFKGRKFSEIAVDLGLSGKQVRDRHRRMIAKLRNLLSDVG